MEEILLQIIPVTFTSSVGGAWTAVDLSSAIPVGTKEVGGSIRYQTPIPIGGVAAVSIASKSDETGKKDIIFISDVPGYNIAMPFRLSLSEDRRLYYYSTGLANLQITISEYK